MNGFQTSEMDNFEYFDAVLLPQPGAAARIGLNYDMRLATPAPTAPWFGMLSLGNTGFNIGARRIPVDADFLALGTFGSPAFGLVGCSDNVEGNPARESLSVPRNGGGGGGGAVIDAKSEAGGKARPASGGKVRP